LEAIFGVFIAIEAVAMFINFVQADIPAKDVVIGTFVPYVSTQICMLLYLSKIKSEQRE
jgi:hypothetical protein